MELRLATPGGGSIQCKARRMLKKVKKTCTPDYETAEKGKSGGGGGDPVPHETEEKIQRIQNVGKDQRGKGCKASKMSVAESKQKKPAATRKQNLPI